MMEDDIQKLVAAERAKCTHPAGMDECPHARGQLIHERIGMGCDVYLCRECYACIQTG